MNGSPGTLKMIQDEESGCADGGKGSAHHRGGCIAESMMDHGAADGRRHRVRDIEGDLNAGAPEHLAPLWRNV